jgi:hypothetical protein
MLLHTRKHGFCKCNMLEENHTASQINKYSCASKLRNFFKKTQVLLYFEHKEVKKPSQKKL